MTGTQASRYVCVLFCTQRQSYVTHFQVNTRYPTLLQVLNVPGKECNKTYHFEQFGVYNLDTNTCGITVVTEYELNINEYFQRLKCTKNLFLGL